jgi:predicted enzyme related to lactoylglutathione lyase
MEVSRMAIGARYAHTNLIAIDWARLAEFYQRVFGCVPVPPERDLAGEAMARGTGIPSAHLRGMHLRLPGHGDQGPTLEIYAYDPALPSGGEPVNRPGFRHLAFAVDDVQAARAEVLANGGRTVGEVVTVGVPGAGSVTWCYVTDPEGNILELQSWVQS